MSVVHFDGRAIVKPGAYSRVDASGMLSAGLTGGKIPLFVGEADDGEPQQIMYFDSPSEARRVLGGGNLLQGMQIAWSPSTNLSGAGMVACVRANLGTQAIHNFVDMMTLTSYGYNTKKYQYKIAIDPPNAVMTITDGTITEVFEAANTAAAMIAIINESSGLVYAEILGTGASVLTEQAVLINFTTQGTSPIAAFTDWETAVDLAEMANVQAIVPVTDDETIHAYVKDHVLRMSNVLNRKERRMFAGHDFAETVSEILARAVNLGTHRATLVTPGMKRVVSGAITTLPAVYTACAIAGMWAGSPDEHPLTFDYINALGLERSYSSAELVQLIRGGVTPIEDVPGKGYRVVMAQTTHLRDSNILYKELSVSTLADSMSRELRKYLEDRFVGKTDTTVVESARNATETKLNMFVREGWLVAGTDQLTGAEFPPYRHINVTKIGTAISVEWEGSPIVPNNYILITAYFTL